MIRLIALMLAALAGPAASAMLPRGGVVVVPGWLAPDPGPADPGAAGPDLPADILRGKPAPGGLLRGDTPGPPPGSLYVPPPLPDVPEPPAVEEAFEPPGWPPLVEDLAPPPGHAPPPRLAPTSLPMPPLPLEPAAPRLVPPDVPLSDPAR